MTDKWETAIALAKVGKFDDIETLMGVRYYRAWKMIRGQYQKKPKELFERDNYWIVAPGGYGKSTYAKTRWPDYHDKKGYKWFDGYKGQSTLLLDDYGPKQCEYLAWYIRRWADLYPFQIETKIGGRFIRPANVVVTSQYDIINCFKDYRMVEAIQRRFKVINLEHWEKRCN